MQITRNLFRMALTGLFLLALSIAPAKAAMVSVNIAAGNADDGSVADQSNILPGETFGLIESSNWNNLYNSAQTDWSISGLHDDTGAETGVSVSTLSGWDAKGYKGDATIGDTPFRFGVYSKGSLSTDGSVVSVTFTGLDSVGDLGYYIIAYIGGDPSTANQKVIISDGTTTYYSRNPGAYTAELIPITDSVAPDGSYNIGNYAVFGSEEAPLTGDTITLTLQAKTGDTRTAGFGAFQIVGFGEATSFWRGLPMDATGWVDTGSFMGWIYVMKDPWVYLNSLQGWVYYPEAQAVEAGAWIYTLNP